MVCNRKVVQKTVVAVKIEENHEGKQRSEGPPSDCWSWRKYGQKPIKGSPYPRYSFPFTPSLFLIGFTLFFPFPFHYYKLALLISCLK